MKKLKVSVIKEELVALTGDYIDAVYLNQMIYWSERVRDFDKFIAEENERIELNGDEKKKIDIGTYGWIYKSKKDLENETMVKVSKRKFKTIFDKFIKNGWMERRNNPLYKWDRTYQYRLNLVKIAEELNKIGYHLTGYRADIKKEPLKDTKAPTDSDKSTHHSEPNAPVKDEPDTSYTRDYYREYNSKITEENTNTCGTGISSEELSEIFNSQSSINYVPASITEYEQHLGLNGNGSADADALSDVDFMTDAVKLHFIFTGAGLDAFEMSKMYEHYIPQLLIRRPHLAVKLLDKFISHPKSQISPEQRSDFEDVAHVHYEAVQAEELLRQSPDQQENLIEEVLIPAKPSQKQLEVERRKALADGFEKRFPTHV